MHAGLSTSLHTCLELLYSCRAWWEENGLAHPRWRHRECPNPQPVAGR